MKQKTNPNKSLESQSNKRFKHGKASQVRLHLALANIEKMDDASLVELQMALHTMDAKNGFRPALIGLTETWEGILSNTDYSLEGYSYIGKPIERAPSATRNHGGTAFWVADSMVGQCSKISPTRTHDDVLWIQIMGNTHTTYVAVVYSRPKDDTNHSKIMTTLAHNYAELSAKGRVVIMGDLNSKITTISRKVKTTYGKYETALMTLLNTTNLTPLTASSSIINKGEHWTFLGRNGGKSIPDYFLVDETIKAAATYAVHHDINLQSQHRLMTATLPYGHTGGGFDWGRSERTTFDWTREGILEYKNKMNSLYQGSNLQKLEQAEQTDQTEPTNGKAQKLAAAISKLMSAALKECTTVQPAKSRNPPSRGHKPDHAIHGLVMRKKALLNSLKLASKQDIVKTWRRIQLIQKQIQACSAEKWINKNAQWWKAISELDDNAEAREFWKLNDKFKARTDNTFPTIIKDEEGRIYRKPIDIMNHLKEYYQEISANKDKPARKFYTSMGMDEEDINTQDKEAKNEYRAMKRKNDAAIPDNGPCHKLFTLKELAIAISNLKNNKATGVDDIPSEALKHLPDMVTIALLRLYNMIWALSITPALWNDAVTTLLHKKDDRMLAKNYRPITLLTALFKTWETLLEKRTRTIIKGKHPPNAQMGSSKQNSAAYTIMAKLSIMRQARKANTPIITLQIDMNKAYNRVCHEVLWTDLYEFGIRGHLLRAIVSTYESARESIKIGKWTSDPFTLPNGLRQGSVLSPVLYILYTVKLIRALQNTGTGIQITDQLKLPCLMFVDDLATLALLLEHTVAQFIAVQSYALTHRCIINTSKSSVATTEDQKELETALTERGMLIKTTDTYVHLGAKHKLSHIRTHLHPSPAVLHRLSKARAMLAEMMARGFGQTRLSHTATIPIIDKRVISTAIYGLSSLDATASDKSALLNLATDAVRTAFQWPDEDKEKGEWVILEANIIPPIVTVQINDVAAWIRTSNGLINPLIATILKEDDELHAHIIRLCRGWGLTIQHLKMVKNSDLHKTLRQAYRQNTRMQDTSKEDRLPNSKHALGLHLPGTAITRLGIHQMWAGPLMNIRSILRHGHHAEAQKCVFCNTNELHTPAHVISKCSFEMSKDTRTQQLAKLKPTVSDHLRTITAGTLTKIMGGEKPIHLTNEETAQACKAALTIFQTSPMYFPPTD